MIKEIIQELGVLAGLRLTLFLTLAPGKEINHA